MSNEIILETLITKLTKLPAISRRSATKIAYKLLNESDHKLLQEVIFALIQADQKVSHCKFCNTITEHGVCNICRNTDRLSKSIITVVCEPQDIETIENLGVFDGTYFVLGGLINPLDNNFSNNTGITKFIQYLKAFQINEVILALNNTVEGEATINLLHQICNKLNVKCTRYATGMPSGTSFSNLDGNTVLNAFLNRTTLD